jgi:hypothetical protein
MPRLVPIKEDCQDHSIKDHAADHRHYDRAYLAERTAWRDISEQRGQHNCCDQTQNDLDPARPSFVECERNDARGEHRRDENLARYKEWFYQTTQLERADHLAIPERSANPLRFGQCKASPFSVQSPSPSEPREFEFPRAIIP